VAALAESVKAFDGAVVCVSHDQFFVNAIATEAWVVGGPAKQVRRVESFGAYRSAQLKKLNDAQAAQAKAAAAPAKAAKSAASAGPKPGAAAAKAKGQGPAKAKKSDAF
jgi:hypothetical protein